MHCWIDASGEGTTLSKDAISHLMLPYKRPLLAGVPYSFPETNRGGEGEI